MSHLNVTEHFKPLVFALLASSVVFSASVQAECKPLKHRKDLEQLGFAALMQVDFTSLTKNPQQTLFDTAAAAYVISAEEIRHSGMQSIPELLRMVPGVQVAQINSYAYAVSARGFNSSFSNKLQVLLDGQSIYNPEFSGVFWDTVQLNPANIARIEVYRGPNATLWGSNTMNGAINIVTRCTNSVVDQRSQGKARILKPEIYTELDGHWSTNARRYNMLHQGYFNDDLHYRVSASLQQHDSFDEAHPEHAQHMSDRWQGQALNLRLDGRASAKHQWMLQTQLYKHRLGKDQASIDVLKNEVQGGRLQARWRYQPHSDFYWQVQANYDHSERNDRSLFQLQDSQLDLNVTLYHRLNSKHRLLWGAGYRHIENKAPYSRDFEFLPPNVHGSIYQAFIQDDIQLSETLQLIVGSQLEHHYSVAWQLQPSLRVLWKSSDNSRLWGGVSRATRTPSRFEQGLKLEIPNLMSRRSNANLAPEKLTAYELGWRYQQPKAALDITAFYHDYDDLNAFVQHTALRPQFIFGAYEMDNALTAHSYGVEVASHWKVSDVWTLHMAYTWLHLDADAKVPHAEQIFIDLIEKRSPEYQLSLRSHWKFADGWRLDLWAYYNSELPDVIESSGTQTFSIAEGGNVDLRLAWQVNQQLEIALLGKNLLHQQRSEFNTESLNLYTITQPERELALQARYRF